MRFEVMTERRSMFWNQDFYYIRHKGYFRYKTLVDEVQFLSY